jgi:DNA-binding CsgD family transcriptional regulator
LPQSDKRRIFGAVPLFERLGIADVDAVLGVISEAAAHGGREPFGGGVIDRLGRLVGADQAGYFEYRLADVEAYLPASTVNVYNIKQPGPDLSWNSAEIAAALPSWPLHDSRHVCTVTAARFSDALATRAKRLRNPWYVTAMRPSGMEHEMKLWLSTRTPFVRGFFFVREIGRRDFDERDRAVLTVLRPHLGVIRERWEQRRRPAGLTERELEVLYAVEEGLTNRAIAERLVISPLTVRTHLENVFSKLGAHTRTAALERAFRSEHDPDTPLTSPPLAR